MSYDQVAMDTKDGRHDSDAFKSEIDKELLKSHPPLDLCYDLAIDSVCYRVNVQIAHICKGIIYLDSLLNSITSVIN